jgi:dipeptidyl aminopeptidase/acylaminoacyl peptidase
VLALYDLATRTKLKTVYRNDKWDVSDAWLDEEGVPYAVDFTDDRDRRVWLRPEMAKLQTQLEKALKVDEVWIGSQAKDKSRMLVYAGGESDPGEYYVYDKGRRALDPFVRLRAGLDTALLTKPKPVSYIARDGTEIAGYLTLPRGRPLS